MFLPCSAPCVASQGSDHYITQEGLEYIADDK